MTTITCIDCGAAAERSSGVALRCLPCANATRPRIAAPGRERAGYVRPLKRDGRWVCVDCNATLTAEVGGRKVAPASRCHPCGLQRAASRDPIRNSAASAVAKAVRNGQLPRPAALVCVDCGRPAEVYDHRDYTKPLQVDPVCRSCNIMRGPADVWTAQSASSQP